MRTRRDVRSKSLAAAEPQTLACVHCHRRIPWTLLAHIGRKPKPRPICGECFHGKGLR